MGYPTGVSRAQYQNLFGLAGNFWSFFGQDNIRPTPNLTLNAGLRWELNPFYEGIRGQKSGFDPVSGKLVLPSNADPTAQLFAAPQFDAYRDRIAFTRELGRPVAIQPRSNYDVAPRLGLAWRPSGGNHWVLRIAYGLFDVFPDGNTVNDTGNSTPFVATQTVFNDPAPSVPTRAWGDFFLGQSIVTPNPKPGQKCSFGFVANSCATPDLSAGALTMRSTYLQQWHFSIQRQISSSTAIDLAYVGNKTTHVNLFTSISDPPPGPGAIQERRPWPQWGGIRYSTFDGNANYNAIQAKIETRSWNGLNVLASYAFSKCIDNGSSQGGTTTLLIPLNRAVCDYDLPHTFAGGFSYELPFGRGRKFWSGASALTQQLIGAGVSLAL